jgi:hypothetical protein
MLLVELSVEHKSWKTLLALQNKTGYDEAEPIKHSIQQVTPVINKTFTLLVREYTIVA